MNKRDALKHPVFTSISQAADQMEKSAFVIGGFVRDFILDRNNKKDVDIVIEGSGIELAKTVAQLLNHKGEVNIFKRFGTAMLHHQGVDWEFVGARKESYSQDSRKPAVENGTLQDDQNRRDFTINAMAISLNQEDYGEFVDPFNGMSDLENKIIRTPLDPDITYSDDPLRMMRAVRFAAQLDFEIEQASFESIQRNAHRLQIISMERIIDEFQKIMQTPKPSKGLLLLDEAGLLKEFFPELIALKGIEEIEGQRHKDNFYHTFEVVDNVSETTDNIWLRWAALLHDVGKAQTKRFDPKIGWTFHSHEFVGAKMVPKIFRRLKLPMGEPMKYVRKLVMLSSRPIPLVSDEATDSALRRLLFDASDDLEDLFKLCKADITTKNPKRQARYKANFEKVEQKIKKLEERDQLRNFQPPVTGEDIMHFFDLKPGKEIGIIKNKIKDAILDGELSNDREKALEYMIKIGKDLKLKQLHK